MYYFTSQHSLPHLPCIDLQDFKPSGITVIEGSSSIVPEILYQMDALLGESLCEAIECWNPAVLAISYLPSLFSGADGRKV